MGGRLRFLFAGIVLLHSWSLATGAAPAAPSTPKIPRTVTAPHGAMRVDDYAWLRDDTRSDPDVLAHLRAENAYADSVLMPLRPLQARLQREAASASTVDASLPYRVGDHWYYERTEAGRQYPVILRRRAVDGAPEEILLDIDALARGRPSYRIAARELSPDGNFLAFAEDPVGQRQYSIRVKDLRTGRMLRTRIVQRAASMAWANDSRTLLTVENDSRTLQPRRVTRHVFDAAGGIASEAPVYDESDPAVTVAVERSRSGAFLCISIHGMTTSEYRCADAAGRADADAFEPLAPRVSGITYFAQHFGGRWVFLTNWNAPGFRIMTADAAGRARRETWKDWIAHDPERQIEGVEFFDSALVVNERVDGQLCLRIAPNGAQAWTVASEDAVGALRLARNLDPASTVVRYHSHALTRPRETYELDLLSRQTRVLQRSPEPRRFSPDAYVSERRWVVARDGTKVPVSLAYRRDLPRDGSAALLQIGYGAYGMPLDPAFNPMIPALLDRGVVYAIAHVRGGGELGHGWHDAGRRENKSNSISDFVDVTSALIEAGYASPGRVAAMGASAGGLLVGAAVNREPQLYSAIVAEVPFVDVVTTMLDPDIPLTAAERGEWGDPTDPSAYRAMLAFSPYDGVRPQPYPAMYVSSGLWDTQVPYFEPAKWVARLRASTLGLQPIMLRTDMDGGHGGATSRALAQSAAAEVHAFILNALSATELTPAARVTGGQDLRARVARAGDLRARVQRKNGRSGPSSLSAEQSARWLQVGGR